MEILIPLITRLPRRDMKGYLIRIFLRGYFRYAEIYENRGCVLKKLLSSSPPPHVYPSRAPSLQVNHSALPDSLSHLICPFTLVWHTSDSTLHTEIRITTTNMLPCFIITSYNTVLRAVLRQYIGRTPTATG